MKTIFISYANEAMAWSLKRIGRQARRLGIFDEVILYTPADLPQYVKDCPLMEAKRGAGYWCWKPALIQETLNKYEDGSVVVYVDAGCTLRKSSTWNMMLRLMDRYDSIVFQYDAVQPQWEQFGSSSSANFHWTKRATLEFLDGYLKDSHYRTNSQVWGGVLLMKNKENSLLKQWRHLVFTYPQLIADPDAEERNHQHDGFIAHRHDQSILSALTSKEPQTLILPEISERYTPDAFIYASRIRAKNARQGRVIIFKQYLRQLLGDTFFERIRKTLK